jgi:hypothetical protein
MIYFKIVDGFKKNEEELKKYVEEYKIKLRKSVSTIPAPLAKVPVRLTIAERTVFL